MRSVIFCIGLFFLIPVLADGQEGADFNRINNETYRLYLEEQWDSVVMLGKTALRQEIDYYYLRMRIGIAYYHKKNFRVAASHFLKALEMNQGDPVAQEYLYYARLMAGQAQQASVIRSRFSGELSQKLPAENGRFFKAGGIEYLYTTSDFIPPADIPLEFYTLPEGVLTVPLHFSNLAVSLENGIAPGISLLHTYSYLSKDNYYHQNEGTGIFYIMDKQHVVQHQYYFSPQFTTRSGLTLLPMAHLISTYYQAILSSSGGGGGYMGGAGTSTVDYVNDINLAGGMTMVKNWRRIDLSAGASMANLNGARQFQGRFGITWYPLGNLNLYAGAGLSGQHEWSRLSGLTRWVPDLKVGGAIAEKVWIEAAAALGEMHNYLEGNGSIVYNGYSAVMEKKAKLSLLIPVSKKGSLLYLGGRWTSGYSSFIPVGELLPESDQLFELQTFSLYGGISWKF
jgi:tetratricopeptide (TPR) repeat protein